MQSVLLWQLSGFSLVSLGGTLLHFLYDWLGESVLIAPFSGVNESTWEHMKLLFWPMLLFAILESFFFRDRADYWCVKLRGTLLGILLIPVLFYTYNGAIGPSPDWLNIAIFFLCAALAFLYETRALKKATVPCPRPWLAITALGLIALLFVLFTFFPLPLEIFRDPTTGRLGR